MKKIMDKTEPFFSVRNEPLFSVRNIVMLSVACLAWVIFIVVLVFFVQTKSALTSCETSESISCPIYNCQTKSSHCSANQAYRQNSDGTYMCQGVSS